MYGLYNNYGFGMMNGFGGWIMMIVFWVLLVLFVVWIVREISNHNRNSSARALEILKERYAKGEINKEEFESKKKDLLM